MSQVLDLFLTAAYGQICFADRGAELPWDLTFDDHQVAAESSNVTVAVADEEPESGVHVEVFLGSDDLPSVKGLQKSFDGTLHLTRPGLSIFAPTGDEAVLDEIGEGLHRLLIFRDSYPTSRLLVVIDG